MPRHTAILTEAERIVVAGLIATFHTNKAIVAHVKEHFDKTMSENLVSQYRCATHWQPLIQRCRDAWAAGIMEMPLAHTRGRMEHLHRLLNKVGDDLKLTPDQRYEKALAILREARYEMSAEAQQKNSVTMNNLFITSITQASHEELIQRRDALVKKVMAFRVDTITGGTNGTGEAVDSGGEGHGADRQERLGDAGAANGAERV